MNHPTNQVFGWSLPPGVTDQDIDDAYHGGDEGLSTCPRCKGYYDETTPCACGTPCDVCGVLAENHTKWCGEN